MTFFFSRFWIDFEPNFTSETKCCWLDVGLTLTTLKIYAVINPVFIYILVLFIYLFFLSAVSQNDYSKKKKI